jgi:hypothetical protein
MSPSSRAACFFSFSGSSAMVFGIPNGVPPRYPVPNPTQSDLANDQRAQQFTWEGRGAD